MDIDILIRGGTVYDGTGDEPFIGDVAMTGERLSSITKGQRYAGKAKKIIDARDLSVAPGFIDTHAHSEFTLLADGRAEGKVLQGVTTEINGNCGLSAAPLYGEAREHREDDQREMGIEERWSTFGEYFQLLEKNRPAINVATVTGHGNLRASVMGFSDRDPDSKEMQRMQALLKEAVREGAIGLSTGLIYPPGVYAKTEEIIGLAQCIKDLIYTSHMRSESDHLIEAIEEAIRIGRESGIAVHISHLKTGGRNNWTKIDEALAVIEGARDEGLPVTCDRYPYTAASTDLDAVLPSWTYAGGTDEEKKRLRDPAGRAAIKKEIVLQHPEGDYWDSIVISSMNTESNKWMEGKTLSYLSERAGKEPVDFLLDMLIAEGLRIGAIFHSMNENNLRRFLSRAYLMIGSDSSVRSADGPTHKGKPHPRGFGTFPRFLGRYARDLNLMGMGEAIRKITRLPSVTFGLMGRGHLREGFFADVVVFDERRIIDGATFEEPFLKPEGIHCVLVNGSPVVWEGALTGSRPGKILRNGR
jgi:N-acyl-D-amino-acid deacylase